MSLTLPVPPKYYDQRYLSALNESLEAFARRVILKGTNIEMGSASIILTAPDGGRWKLGVNNAGTLTTTAA